MPESVCFRLPAAAPSGPRSRRRGVAVALVLAVLTVLAALVSPSPAAARQGAAGAGGKLGDCAAGQLCLWERAGFAGKRLTFELAGTDIESCVRLPGGFAAASYGNRTGRPVTVYQSAECDSTGEFHTHPSGSWTPESAYQVRAFKIWER